MRSEAGLSNDGAGSPLALGPIVGPGMGDGFGKVRTWVNLPCDLRSKRIGRGPEMPSSPNWAALSARLDPVKA